MSSILILVLGGHSGISNIYIPLAWSQHNMWDWVQGTKYRLGSGLWDNVYISCLAGGHQTSSDGFVTFDNENHMSELSSNYHHFPLDHHQVLIIAIVLISK